MTQPYNYMLNLPDPSQSVMGGLQQGMALSQMMAQRQKMIADQQTAAAMQADMAALAKSPSTGAIAQMALKYPQLADQLKSAHAMLSEEQKQARLDEATQVYAALQSGKPEIAQKVLGEYAASYRNSGREQDAKVLDDMAQLIKTSPETASASIGLHLSSAMGPEKFADTFTKLNEAERVSAADAQFRELMKGAESVDDVFARIPQVAQLGDEGIKIATRLLEKQRLMGEYELRKQESTAKLEEQDMETTRSFGLLNAMFKRPGGGEEESGFRLVKTAGGQEIQADEKAWDKLKSMPEFDRKKAQALGLDEPTMTAIQGMMAISPKEGAKLLTQVVSARIKQQLTPGKLDKVTEEVRAYEQLTPQQKATYEKLQSLKRSKTEVNLGDMVDKKGGEEAGKLFDKWFDSAATGAQQLRDIDRYAGLVDKAIIGPGATARLKLEQLGIWLGFTGSESAAKTRELLQGFAELTLQSRQMLRGQGAITESEGAMLERARSGDLSMTGAELKNLFKVFKRAITAKTQRDAGLLRNAARKGSEIAKMYVEELDASAPAPQKPGAQVKPGAKNVIVDY
jgi:hypothetical protein